MTTELPSLDLVYAAAQERIRVQFEQIAALDTKASISLAASGIILAALIGFLSEVPQEFVQALAIGLIFVSMAAFSSVIALWMRNFDYAPNVGRLRDLYIVESVNETKLAIVDVSLEVIERNHGRIRTKIWALIAAFVFLLLGILSLASYLLLLLLD